MVGEKRSLVRNLVHFMVTLPDRADHALISIMDVNQLSSAPLLEALRPSVPCEVCRAGEHACLLLCTNEPANMNDADHLASGVRSWTTTGSETLQVKRSRMPGHVVSPVMTQGLPFSGTWTGIQWPPAC